MPRSHASKSVAKNAESNNSAILIDILAELKRLNENVTLLREEIGNKSERQLPTANDEELEDYE